MRLSLGESCQLPQTSHTQPGIAPGFDTIRFPRGGAFLSECGTFFLFGRRPVGTHRHVSRPSRGRLARVLDRDVCGLQTIGSRQLELERNFRVLPSVAETWRFRPAHSIRPTVSPERLGGRRAAGMAEARRRESTTSTPPDPTAIVQRRQQLVSAKHVPAELTLVSSSIYNSRFPFSGETLR